jgi:hypothetical protein
MSADGISLIDAVRILAGREVHAAKDKCRYERHVSRIKTAVKNGQGDPRR